MPIMHLAFLCMLIATILTNKSIKTAIDRL